MTPVSVVLSLSSVALFVWPRAHASRVVVPLAIVTAAASFVVAALGARTARTSFGLGALLASLCVLVGELALLVVAS